MIIELSHRLEEPFRGLRHFDREHAHLFFGRDTQVGELLKELHRSRLVTVLGSSGSGKSSLVRAGLLPGLRGGFLAEAGARWRTIITRPANGPLRALAADLKNETGYDPQLTLCRGPLGLIEAMNEARLEVGENVILVVDQFEELFRFQREAKNANDASSEAAAYVKLLLEASQQNKIPIHVVLTMRSDFLGSCSQFRDLPECINDGVYLVPRMRRDEIEQAIVGPVHVVGVEIAASLVQRVLNDLGEDSDQLPVLQHTLLLTWNAFLDRRDKTTLIELEDYEATGGLHRGLSRHANRIFDELPTTEKSIARVLFQRLVERDPENHEIRRRATIREVAQVAGVAEASVSRVVNAFAAEGAWFLTRTDGLVDITHESLIRKWDKITGTDGDKGWLREEEEGRDVLVELSKKMSRKKSAEDFLRGTDLDRARKWQEERRNAEWSLRYGIEAETFADIQKYIDSSAATRARERRHTRFRMIALNIGGITLALVFFLLWLHLDEQSMHVTIRSVLAASSSEANRDPTRAALLLAELHDIKPRAYDSEEEQDGAALIAVLTRSQISSARLRGHEDQILGSAYSFDGSHIVTASLDKTARVWASDGRGETIILEGHTDRVNAATFSPDGSRVVTASGDKTARVWSSDGRGNPVVLQGHTGSVDAVAFSPDGSHVVTASWDQTARVWSADGQGEPVVLQGHTSFVSSVAFSPDGSRVVTASGDGTARVWPSDGRGEPAVLRGHIKQVNSAAFSPDGSRVVTASTDKTARVWSADGRGGAPIILQGHSNAVISAAFSPDGSRVVTSSLDGTAGVWSVDGRGGAPIVLRGHSNAVISAAFSPDGSRVVTSSLDGTAGVWSADGRGGTSIVLRGHSDAVISAAFSSDGRHVVTASWDKTARVWSTDRRGETIILHHSPIVYVAAFSSDASRIVTASWDETARVWSSDGRGAPVVLRGHTGPVQTATFSPNGSRVVTASDDKTARVWSLDGAVKTIVLQGHSGAVRAAAFSPDGSRVVTASDDKTARVWASDGRAEAVVLQGHTGPVKTATFSSDGSRVVTASDDKTARVWSLDGAVKTIVLQGHSGAVRAAAFSPDGSRVVTASGDKTARVWSSDGRGKPVVLQGHTASVEAVAFSPDGSRVVTASSDGTARVWSFDDQGEVVVLRGHKGSVNAAAFSHDGARVVTASDDENVRVWSSDGRGETIVFQGHDRSVQSATFSPDGSRVLTSSLDGTARVWRLDWRDLITDLLSNATICLTPEDRTRSLAENPEVAAARYEACERSFGRTETR